MTTAAPKSQQALAIVKRKDEIAAASAEFAKTLPATIPTEKFVRTMQTAIQLNPDLAIATMHSVMAGCLKAAADGLVIDNREATLTVYNVKKKDAAGKEAWVKEAVYVPMVTGIMKRVRNSGEVSRFNAFVVHENDVFRRTLGLDPTLIHEPNDDNPGKAKGAYAVCLYKDGALDYEYMTAAQIMKIGNDTKNAHQYDPSKGKSYEEWWRKTVIRRLSKRLPMSSDLAQVIKHVDDYYEAVAPESSVDAETGEVIESNVAEKPKRSRKAAGAAAEKLAEATSSVSTEQAAPEQNSNVQEAQYEEVDQGEAPWQDDNLADDVI